MLPRITRNQPLADDDKECKDGEDGGGYQSAEMNVVDGAVVVVKNKGDSNLPRNRHPHR